MWPPLWAAKKAVMEWPTIQSTTKSTGPPFKNTWFTGQTLMVAWWKPFWARNIVSISCSSSKYWLKPHLKLYLGLFLVDGSFQGVAFDWISGNLYIGTDKGKAVMCDTNHIPSPTCHLLFSGQNDVEDIALDVVCGYLLNWFSAACAERKVGYAWLCFLESCTGQALHGVGVQFGRAAWMDQVRIRL